MQIKGKTAMITGASKGIGRATALALAQQGANLAISARSAGQLEEVAQQTSQLGVHSLAFVGDMSEEEEIKAFVRSTTDRFGRIDILVNNAGLGHFAPVAEMATDQWDEMFNLNVRGLFIATREALPFLRKQKESVVVNVASLAGKNAFIGGGGYAATKHAVLRFSRCLMLEERKNGVRVLAVCPGSVATSFSSHHRRADADQHKVMLAEDVASAIVHMIAMPQRCMISEIDMRPTNP